MTGREPSENAPVQQTAEFGSGTKTWLLAVALVIVTFVAYIPILHAGFIWDDDDHLTANPAMTATDGLRRIWSSLSVSRYYPLTLTTFWVEHRLWGLHPLPYHAVNVVLHAANAVLIWMILRRLRAPGAWAAAAIWAVHPVNVGSVAWITELKNTQSGVFFFLSLIFWLRYRARLRIVWYTQALLCCAAAILSKPSTVILPAVLLWIAWWWRERWTRMDWLRLIPFFALAAGMSVLTVVEQRGNILQAGTNEWNLGLAERFVIAGKAVSFYAAKLLWPVNLAAVYPRWDVQAMSLLSWLPLAGLAAGGAMLWAWRQQLWARATLFGLGFFVAALLPVLGFFDIYYFCFSFVADHFQYLASIGVIALAVAAGASVLRQRAARAAATGIVIAGLGFLNWQRCRVFHDEDTLWRDTLAKNPACWIGYNNWGLALVGAGNIQKAIEQYNRALEIRPAYADAQNNLGIALAQEGKLEEAIGHFKQAMQINPNLLQAHLNLGSALRQTGNIEDAIAQDRQAVRLRPDSAEAHRDLGASLLQGGAAEEGIGHLEESVRLKPDQPETHNNLGVALARIGRISDAIPHFEAALRLKPDFSAAKKNLNHALADQSRTIQ
jgi:tetratricopeptide (TPR) repeat protein